MNLSLVAPGRCLLRAPPDPGEAQRIPRYHPNVPLILLFVFCPACGRRVVVREGVVEHSPVTVETDVETSDGGTRRVSHLVPKVTMPEQACSCGSRWCVTNGLFMIRPTP